MSYYLMVIAAAILLAFDFVISKKYQELENVSIVSGLKYNAWNGLFTAIIFFFFLRGKLEFSPFSILLAFFMSLCGIAYSILGFRILKHGNMALYSIFLMSGGMLLPFLYGILFLNEKLSVCQFVGVIVIFAAIILSNQAKNMFSKSQLLLCFAVFVLNGFVSVISKIHQIDMEHYTVSALTFVMYSGIGKFVFSSIVLWNKQRIINNRFIVSRKSMCLILASAIAGGVSYLLQLMGASKLPATVLYPLVTGGSIIFSALLGRIFYREKLSKQQIASIVLCFFGTCLFL